MASASEFIGLAVLITLKDSAKTKLHGTIENIINQDLILINVTFTESGYQLPRYIVPGTTINALDVIPSPEVENVPSIQHALPVQSTSQAQAYQPPIPLTHTAPTTATQAHQFIDPAILSFTRAPSVYTQPQPQAVHAPPTVSSIAARPAVDGAPPPKPQASPPLLQQNSSKGVQIALPIQPAPPLVAQYHGSSVVPNQAAVPSQKYGSFRGQAQLQAPFQELSLGRDTAAESSAFDETDDNLSALPAQQPAYSGKRSRRGKGRRYDQNKETPSPNPRGHKGATYISSSGFTPSRQNGGRNQRNFSSRSNYNQQQHTEEEGWATEDVNDIRETEFDFQGNLDRFDKKSVFNQIRAEDNTADEARLVSFNRLPQRSSSKERSIGRKNYRNNENVLATYSNGQPLSERDVWNRTPIVLDGDDSDVSNFSDRGRGDAVNSGRSSRRAMSRSVPRRPSAKQQALSGMSSLLTQGASSSGGGGGGQTAAHEPKSKGTIRIAFNSRLGPGLPPFDLERSRICPIVSPLQMLDVERIAETEMGLEEILMTENAARGIASVAIQAFGTRLSSTNHNPLPVVLVFAGNNKSGARAIAAGRHLKNHHVRVMVCAVGLDREDELLENVRRQLSIFRNCGGRVARLEELTNSLKSIDSPPELIIDGLLGIHMSFEDLRTDDQATAFELVNFANKSSASVLAVDVPSGIDGHTGEIAQLEDTGKFHVRARWVVSLGAPKTGLLQALDSGLGAGWKLFVADIGIPSAAWRKYGSRRRHGVEFGADWVVPLEHIVGH